MQLPPQYNCSRWQGMAHRGWATCLCMLWRWCLASPSGTDGSDSDLVQGGSLQPRHSAWGIGHHGFNDSVPIFGREEVTGGPWHCSPFDRDTVADFWICLINSGYFGSWKRFWSCALAKTPIRITSFIILLFKLNYPRAILQIWTLPLLSRSRKTEKKKGEASLQPPESSNLSFRNGISKRFFPVTSGIIYPLHF